jgi:Arc/MetJ-type ribon-helix-helix transcriptional regulator
MTVMKRRSKMISVRLSEQEYRNLVALCEQRGARSLSDLARDAMSGLLSDGNGKAVEVERLQGRVMELENEVRRLARMLERD